MLRQASGVGRMVAAATSRPVQLRRLRVALADVVNGPIDLCRGHVAFMTHRPH